MAELWYALVFRENKKTLYLNGSGHKDPEPDNYTLEENFENVINFRFSNWEQANEMLDWVKSNADIDDYADTNRSPEEVIKNLFVEELTV